jgi:iron(III) transport system permease protein
MLLLPVVLAFVVDAWMQGRQQAQFSARAVPYAPRPSRGFDAAMFAFCALVCAIMLAVLGMAVFTSFI